MELSVFDLLTVVTTPESIDLPIVIVGIDEPSFGEFDRQWPWPRTIHAELIDKLKRAGAAVIGFDVLFAEPTTLEEDRELADTIRRAGNIVLASDLVLQDSEQFQMAMQVEPIPLLREAGALTGLVSITLDPDLVVRSIPQYPDAFWRRIMQAFAGSASSPDPAAVSSRPRVRYIGPDHSFHYVSYYQALDPEKYLPPGVFGGKIVLVGHDTKVSLGPGSILSDSYATPYSRVSERMTPGVEIQATFVANALAGGAIREVASGWSVALIGLAVLVVSTAMPRWQVLRGAIVVLAVMSATAGISVWLFSANGTWLPSVHGVLAVAAMYIVQGGTAFLQERRQRHQIEKAFRYYVSPEIVTEMSAHPESLVLGGARRNITILFTDLVDFTSVSESMSPEQVSALLNDYFTHMTRIILAHGGTVDKFIGDGIMAFWGAPLPDPDQALHACQAVCEMQEELARLRLKYGALGLPQLHMRVGIHSGEAVVGNMGSTDRFDYTAIGDSVNLASRLEGINRLYGTETLISGETAQLLSGRMPLRRIDRVIVKGKSLPVDIFTFCTNTEIARLSEEALDHYIHQNWEKAASAWKQLALLDPQDAIAGLFLQRMGEFRNCPPSSDWDGSTAL